MADESARDDQATQYAPLSTPSQPASAAFRAAPTVGERVGKYVIQRTIGHGGMGIVVAARHETLDEMVAIKLLHPKAAKDAVQVERFVREARATVRIKSEHVVRVLDAGAEESTGAPYIVMELLDGRDLGYVLSHTGPLPQVKAVDYIIQICEGLGAAHALGIIHRDLKPSNFFLTHRADGAALVKVLDFGISKAAQSDGSPDPRLTETQAVFGSPTYMSPEQIRSSKNVDARSDVWSLGVALFELLTGKLPFVADNVAGLLASVIADAPFAISSFVDGVAPEVEAIVAACLEKDASRRVGSAAELATRLAPFASPEGAQLAARVEKSARGFGSSPSMPPLALPGSMPPPALGLKSDTRRMAPSVPAPPLSSASAAAPAVSFGSTGTDLSATGPAGFQATVRRGSGRKAAMVALVVAVLGVGAVIVYAAGSRRGPRAAATSTSTMIAPMASTPAAPVVASAAPVVASAAEITPPPVTPRPPRGKGAPRPGAHASASAASAPPAPPAPPAAAPPSPASPNLDSRF